MKKQAYDEDAAEKLLPLLVSIGREIKNRMRAVDALEKELGERQRGDDNTELVARLAIEKRELRTTLTELERLGCELDADHPLRILIPGLNGPMAFEGSLEKTMFRFRPSVEEKT
ncbi:MAG: DUF2203 family protein [Planctomycetes bacterium]|nr:DUF2203 family protein [Planctomycetota bacterium]